MKMRPLLNPRTLRWSAGVIALAFCLGSAPAARAQTRYTGQPRSNSVKIQGTSTLHDWEMQGVQISGYIEFGAGVQLDPAQTNIAGIQGNIVPAKVHNIIPVASIHSEAEIKADVMDNLMKEAMKEDKFRFVIYDLTELSFKGPHAPGKPFDFNSKGELAIAGVTNKVSFPVTIECLDGDKIKVCGTAPVKLSDYNVPPPAPNFGLGMMKVGNDVKIIFEWTLVTKPVKI